MVRFHRHICSQDDRLEVIRPTTQAFLEMIRRLRVGIGRKVGVEGLNVPAHMGEGQKDILVDNLVAKENVLQSWA